MKSSDVGKHLMPSLRPMSAARLLQVLLALSLVGFFMWQAGRAGIASLYHFPAFFALQQWQQQSPNEALLQLALEQSRQAVSLQPDNPHYLLMLAKINEWAWFSGSSSHEAALQNEGLYQRAISQRPGWPLAYADFAYFRANVQQRLTDSWPLLEQAAVYGPYMPEVQQKWLSIAFAHWADLSAKQKAQSWQRVELGMRGGLRAVTLQQIKAFGMQRQSCIYLSRRLGSEPYWPALRPSLCQ